MRISQITLTFCLFSLLACGQQAQFKDTTLASQTQKFSCVDDLPCEEPPVCNSESDLPCEAPSPEPSSSPSAAPTPAPSVIPEASVQPLPSVIPEASIIPEPSAAESPAPSPEPSPSASPQSSPSPMPSASPRASASPSPFASPSPKPSVAASPTSSVSPRPSPSARPSASPAPSASPSPIVALRDIEVTLTQPSQSVDLLFVADNSGSMAKEQRKMAQRFPNFINSLGNLDWQIGIVTTDVTTSTKAAHANMTDGNLLPYGYLKLRKPFSPSKGVVISNRIERQFPLNHQGLRYYVLNNQVPDYGRLFQETIQRTAYEESPGSSDERGIFAAFRAIEKNRFGWLRSDANLAVVILSDEDERSDGKNLKFRDVPRNLRDLVRNQFGPSKGFSAHSIITRPGDKKCQKSNGQNYGHVYAALTQLTNGILGNICENDYGAQLSDIAGAIHDSFENLELECAPYNNFVDVSTYPASNSRSTLNGQFLKITPALPPGTLVRLKYKCQD